MKDVMNRSDMYSARVVWMRWKVGLEKIEQVDDFAARVRKVPVAVGEVRVLARRAARVV